jgi:hypothetical protein
MLFVNINPTDLVKGVKYKIEEISHYYFRTFVGIYNGTDDDYLLWNNLSFVAENRITALKNRSYFKDIRIHILSMYYRQIYKLVSSKEKIQQSMETRAVNMVLQQVVGDSTFIY